MQLRGGAAAARDSSHRCFHSTAAVPPRRAGPAAPRRASGTLRGGKAAHLVWRTRSADPLTATDGLETLRGAKAVAPARARSTAFMTANLPPAILA